MDFQHYIGSKIIFSVPIYFRSEEEHRRYFDDKRRRFIENQESIHRQHNNEIVIEDRMRWELAFERFNFHIWKYAFIF